jgi:hypothetical protein
MSRKNQKMQSDVNAASEEELRANAEAIVKGAKKIRAPRSRKAAVAEDQPLAGSPEIAGDSELNGVIRAAAGEEEAEAEEDPLADKPEIQAEGDFPTVDDAFADMSEPPPQPPDTLFVLDRSSAPPKATFRVQKRVQVLDASGKFVGKGTYLWMFRIPFGEALQGEAFVHPIVASLRAQLVRECPALIPVRFEIRLLFDASGKYSLLEVPADPAPTRKGEETRQSLLGVIAQAEEACTLAVKQVGGKWGARPGAIYFPEKWPKQTLEELVRSTYKEDLIARMDNAILQRFRMKINE